MSTVPTSKPPITKAKRKSELVTAAKLAENVLALERQSIVLLGERRLKDMAYVLGFEDVPVERGGIGFNVIYTLFVLKMIDWKVEDSMSIVDGKPDFIMEHLGTLPHESDLPKVTITKAQVKAFRQMVLEAKEQQLNYAVTITAYKGGGITGSIFDFDSPFMSILGSWYCNHPEHKGHPVMISVGDEESKTMTQWSVELLAELGIDLKVIEMSEIKPRN